MHRTLAPLASLLLVAGVFGAACYHYEEDKSRCYICGEPEASTGPGSTGGAGGKEPTDPSCIPSASATPVNDDCGVFVSTSGSNTSKGSKDDPVKSLSKAIDLAGKGSGRVYACSEDLEGAVTVPSGIEIYGGLDCKADWAYPAAAKPTKILAAPGAVALTLLKGIGVTRLADLHVIAQDAMTAGDSSIAAMVDGATAELVRMTLEAGKGAEGLAGEMIREVAMPGVDGNAGSEACSASVVLGGNEVANTCGDVASIGGNGGQGNTASGGSGTEGSPGAALNGGSGEKMSACADGLAGDTGTEGMPGAGGTGLGTLGKTGFNGMPGAEGGPGAPGQGGGGGGGSKGGAGAGKCDAAMMAGGASGGSGASGGCGGVGGKGGGSGGSSIALVSLDAKLTLDGVKLISKGGGSGGSGGLGQEGGLGGASGGLGGGVPDGAFLLKAACAGGLGGDGGRGGPGGNGSGGHSIGIAFIGTAPTATEVMFQQGEAGDGGIALDPAGQIGSNGVSVETLNFSP